MNDETHDQGLPGALGGDEVKDFEIEVRVRNNHLRRRRRELGLTSAELCRAVGIRQSEYSGLECMRLSPIGKTGAWRLPALRLAEFYGESPEALWPDAVLAIKKTVGFVEAYAADLLPMLGDSNPELLLSQRDDARKVVEPLLAALPERAVHVLRRHAVDGASFRVIGGELGVCAGRAQQIYKGALHMLTRESGRKEISEAFHVWEES